MVSKNKNFYTEETAWCPGCGNFNIIEALKNVLNESGKEPHEVLIVGGIGQAAKTSQYINANSFCGLHGRALPPAIAAKIANKNLTVIVNTGDGDSYGEGGNHFIHNIRRNVDITHFVHNNQIYGLTKGQASPTSDVGHKTKVQPMGSLNQALNPILLSLSLGIGFVARAFSGNITHLQEVMRRAINYNGYSLVDILQPCVSFNKVNTFKWYSDRVYELDKNYNCSDKMVAIKKAMEWGDKIPIGVIFEEEKTPYHDNINFLKAEALIDKKTNMKLIKKFMNDFK